MFRYAGEDIQGNLPQYVIEELPEGFVEDREKVFAGADMVTHYYENEKGEAMLFEYVCMQQGGLSSVSIEDANAVSVSVNGCDGLLLISEKEGYNSTLTWIDPANNLQFTIDAPLNEQDILHIAQSVCLVETTK